MENNNLESISDSILKSLIYDILNMKTIDTDGDWRRWRTFSMFGQDIETCNNIKSASLMR